MNVCVCVWCVCVCILTSWFWLGTGSVSPNRTLLCLCAGVRGWRGSSFSPAVIRKVRVCSVIHTYTTVYSSESHIVTREEREQRKVRHVFGTRGGRRAALESLHCELLYLFHFSFISLSFSPALYWHRGSNAGRVSSEFVLLCVWSSVSCVEVFIW